MLNALRESMPWFMKRVWREIDSNIKNIVCLWVSHNKNKLLPRMTYVYRLVLFHLLLMIGFYGCKTAAMF